MNETRINFIWTDIVDGKHHELIVTGNVIGYSDLNFELHLPQIKAAVENATVKLRSLDSGYRVMTVIKANSLIDKIFTMLAILFDLLKFLFN